MIIRICIVGVALCTMLGFSSCGKKDNGPPPATVKFTTAAGNYNESDGTVQVGITLSAVQAQPVTVQYTWASSDTTTFQGGDFTFGTPSSITIPAGQTSGNIAIQIIDDQQVDGDDVINLTLSGTSSNGALSSLAADKNFALTIADNDVAPADKIQIDLTWHLPDVTSDINAVDLDLNLQENVGASDNGDAYASSVLTSGFETLMINADAPNQAYYVVIPYETGTSALTFNFRIFTFGTSIGHASGKFTSADAPSGDNVSAAFYGPFTKTDGDFEFSGRVERAQLTFGNILMFTVKGFKKKK